MGVHRNLQVEIPTGFQCCTGSSQTTSSYPTFVHRPQRENGSVRILLHINVSLSGDITTLLSTFTMMLPSLRKLERAIMVVADNCVYTAERIHIFHIR